MNRYQLEDISVGMTERFTVTVTDTMLAQFRDMSGDLNPLHNDEAFATARGYKGRVVFGMLCASLYSTLAGVYLPGENCLLHEVSTKFKKPVFVGDTLTVEGTVAEKSDAVNQITVKAVIRNQDSEIVNRAVIKAGVLSEK